ncbi:MAG: SemiSWEET transporter [Brachymonas sp.]|jgi:MtN3 and saliva related transmembrane protein
MPTLTATDVLGYVAMSLTTAAFAPQAWHTLRTRDVSGISLAMYAAFTVGVFFWLIYGLLRGDWPIIIGNAITLALALLILVLKLRYGRDR